MIWINILKKLHERLRERSPATPPKGKNGCADISSGSVTENLSTLYAVTLWSNLALYHPVK